MLEILTQSKKKLENVGAPITFLGASSTKIPSSSPATLTTPGAPGSGDLVLLFITSIGGPASLPAGWVRFAAHGNLYCYYFKPTTTISSVSVTSDSFVRAATVLCYRGAAGVSTFATGTAAHPYTLASLPVALTNSIFINVVCDAGPVMPTKDARQTTRGNYVKTTYHGLLVSDEIMKTTGTTGTRTMVTGDTGPASSGSGCMSILLR